MENPILTEVWRGPRRESFHRGSVIVLRGDETLLELGTVDEPHYPRSAVKPMQAMPLLERGIDQRLGFGAEQVALLSASHSGQEAHVRAVEAMLAAADIPVEALACGPHPPFDPEALRRFHQQNGTLGPQHNNCSGKHAGMLLLARELGAELDGYTRLDHPVQQLVRESIGRFCLAAPRTLEAGVDGCHAPAYLLTLRELARGFSRLADGATLPGPIRDGCRRLRAAVKRAPRFLAGPGILDTTLVEAGLDLFCKRGAEGVIAIALPDAAGGIGIAIKIDDGAIRGYQQPVLRVLEWLGRSKDDLAAHLSEEQNGLLCNSRGELVGRIEASPTLLDRLAEQHA